MSEFRIATWNTQGNAWAEGKLASLVNSCSPDVICLQECGNLFSTSRGDFQRVRSSLYLKYTLLVVVLRIITCTIIRGGILQDVQWQH